MHPDSQDNHSLSELTEVIVDTGYMGDPAAWCYWEAEYPEEGSMGPFGSRDEAAAHALATGLYILQHSK